MNKGLIIFAREPVPGTVKTRLARHMGNEAAARLYRAMLQDVLELAIGLENVRVLLFWDQQQDKFPDFPLATSMQQFRQCSGHLGQRMRHAFSLAFSLGIENCCIIGSDSPDLPPATIMQAFATLEQGGIDVVFGPSTDGGYYLLGMRRVWDTLFEQLPWGSGTVLQESHQRAAQSHLRVGQLQAWYDLDTMPDLQHLAASPGSAAPHTRALLKHLNLFTANHQVAGPPDVDTE